MKWLSIQGAISALPTTSKHILKQYNISNYDKHFKDYPDQPKYFQFRHNLKYGWKIGLLHHYPSRLINSNPKFDYNDLVGIGEQIIRWRQPQYIIGSFPWFSELIW